MLKILLSLCGCVLLIQQAQASELLPEAKVGYFYPTSSKFREIYSGNAIYGLEFSFQAYRQWYPWIAASYFTQDGHSSALKNGTRITLVPLEIGLKYLFHTSRHTRIYVGLGAAPTYLRTRDHSSYVIESVHKWGIGGVAKLGSLVDIGRFFFDFFADYFFTTIDFSDTHHHKLVRHDADVSGLSIGIGIGYRFGGNEKKTKHTPAPTPALLNDAAF